LTLVHSGATLGAVMGAPAIAAIAARAGWAASFRATGVAYAALALAGLVLRFGEAPRSVQTGGAAHEPPPARVSAAILPFAGVAACYVGVETAITLFAPPYAGALALAPERGVAAISAFWFGLLAGRVLFLLWRGPLDARLLVAAGITAALVLGA